MRAIGQSGGRADQAVFATACAVLSLRLSPNAARLTLVLHLSPIHHPQPHPPPRPHVAIKTTHKEHQRKAGGSRSGAKEARHPVGEPRGDQDAKGRGGAQVLGALAGRGRGHARHLAQQRHHHHLVIECKAAEIRVQGCRASGGREGQFPKWCKGRGHQAAAAPQRQRIAEEQPPSQAASWEAVDGGSSRSPEQGECCADAICRVK